MNKDLELEILRKLLFKIANASICRDIDKITLILDSIRYDYCYNQSNSNVGDDETQEEKRVRSLLNLQKL
jgi:hypothetical protein